MDKCSNEEFDNLAIAYREKFDDAFPSQMYWLSGKSRDEMADIIRECLEKGEPCDIEYDDDAVY